MADFSTQRVTIHRYEVTLPNPTVLSELGKAETVAINNFANVMGRPVRYDDDIKVKATDEEIILYFEKEQKDGG